MSDSSSDKPEDLLSVTKRGQQSIAKEATSGNPHTPLDSPAAQSYLTDLGALSEKYAPSAPPETQKSLADAVSKANELYKAQANKNEWLEVAQILGRAGAQYAAAQAGMANGGQYGRNMAALDPGAGIDYNARTERAARDRAQSVNEAKDLATTERQNYEDAQKSGAHKYEASKDYLHQGLGAALKEEADRTSEKNANERAARAVTGEDLRDARAIRAAKLHELDIEQKAAGEEDAARKAIANQFLTAGDMSGKSLKKLQETQPQLAAKAGVDLQAVANQMEQQETVRPKWMGGKSGEEETAGKRSILDAILGESSKKLADIKARREALLSAPLTGAAGKPATAPAAVAPSTEGPKKIRVKQKASGQTGTIIESDFDPSKYDRL